MERWMRNNITMQLKAAGIKRSEFQFFSDDGGNICHLKTANAKGKAEHLDSGVYARNRRSWRYYKK